MCALPPSKTALPQNLQKLGDGDIQLTDRQGTLQTTRPQGLDHPRPGFLPGRVLQCQGRLVKPPGFEKPFRFDMARLPRVVDRRDPVGRCHAAIGIGVHDRDFGACGEADALGRSAFVKNEEET